MNNYVGCSRSPCTDSRNRLLLLARDRFGIKPLFYARTMDCLAFASELNALRNFPGVDREPDRQAIADLSCCFSIPAPETFYRGIRSLQPGEVLEARSRNDRLVAEARNYFKWRNCVNPDNDFTDAVASAERLVTQAVRQQLESDVPWGQLLSGGIDSSLVCLLPQRRSGVSKPLMCASRRLITTKRGRQSPLDSISTASTRRWISRRVVVIGSP